MQTRIISAFPGTGKSYIYNNPEVIGKGLKILDSDSSKFSWIMVGDEKVRNPNFIVDYIHHIKQNIGKYDFIFVSSHKDVRKALQENCIFFHLFYPDAIDKKMYLRKYKDRGNPQAFIDLVDKNWDTWIEECRETKYGCKNVCMSFLNLADELIIGINITKEEEIRWNIP